MIRKRQDTRLLQEVGYLNSPRRVTQIGLLYDNFARIHSESWGPELIEWIPEIEKILKQHLPEEVPEEAKILDLCCGTGELAQDFQKKGYQVTGLDSSEERDYGHPRGPGVAYFVCHK